MKIKHKGFIMIEVMFAVLFLSSSFIVIFSLLNRFMKITNETVVLSNITSKKDIIYSINDPFLKTNSIENFDNKYINKINIQENKLNTFAKYKDMKNIFFENFDKSDFLQIMYEYVEKKPEKAS